MASKLVVLCAALATFAQVSFASAEEAPPAKLPNVVILCTGGTIAGTGAPHPKSRSRGFDPAGTSNSMSVRLTRQKSTLFQWLAVPLWVPTGKDSVPTDSG